MSERLLRQQLIDLGLSADAPPAAGDWQRFLRAVERTYRDAGQLRQTHNMEALRRLAGGIAHDFNNLLAVILGDAELALESLASDDPVRADVVEIEAAGRRASLLTEQLLTFSRRHASDPQVIGLDTIVKDMEQALCQVMGENIQIVTTLAPNLGSVEVDPAKAEQAILHLATNARDAMPGGGRLLIETRNTELVGADANELGVVPGRYVALSVEDDGLGMDAETQAQIFEPFFTTKRVGKGTGLGLATVFGIVKQARGGIQVSSAPGTGSTFSLYLPRVDDP